MTRQITRTRILAAGLAGLLALSACSDQVVQPTFGSACRESALRSGETVTGALSDQSCHLPYHFWTGDASRYAAYSVTLERGKGYLFTMQQAPDGEGENSVDALLALWGRDANGNSIPLAVSDDDAEGVNGHDAEFYFIAPKSGTFNLVAATYDDTDLGGYRLSMQECPVVAVADTAGSYVDLPFEASDCVRHSMAGGSASRIVLVAVKAEAGDALDLVVTSPDFTPWIEFGGPGTDVFADVYDETIFSTSNSEPARVTRTLGDVGGTLTLAVGASTLDPVGRFSIGLDRTPALPILRASSTSPELTLRSVLRRPAKR